jgi:para-nitrobenzyl esterase
MTMMTKTIFWLTARRGLAAAFLLIATAMLGQLFAPAAWATDGAWIVRTTAGQVRGVPRAKGGAEFLGIPYAQPPVGDLRWHEPVPVRPWRGVRDAAAFGAPCAQWANAEGEWNWSFAKASQEDCLYLNVITPAWPAKKLLPVMFWIHGGANEGGTASTALFKDGTLVDHGVLLVTINYRLGVFGFFAHPGLTGESPRHASGNYGLMDQILALRWVRANIAKFGGDPANITVFGQSAGALDTGLLMTSAAKGLFQKAIQQSGTPLPLLIQPLSLAQAEQAGVAFAAAVKAPAGVDALKFLRRMTARELMTAFFAQDPQRRWRMAPIVDGWVISRQPAQVFASGQESAIPLLIGSNSIESGSTASPDELRKTIQDADGEFAPQAFELYGLANGGQGAADPLYGTVADQWSADTRFRCPATTEAAWHSAAHHPTYEYEFQRASPGQEAKGAGHSDELPYIFGYYPRSGQFAAAAKFVDTDFKLAGQMETYWTNFAKTGNPNAERQPQWPEFGLGQALVKFTPDGRVTDAAGLRSPQCNLYRKVLAERIKRQP